MVFMTTHSDSKKHLLGLKQIFVHLCSLQPYSQEPKVAATHEWINKMWSTQTVEYYSALTKKKILTSAATWMNLEDVMLGEISQTQKDKYCVTPLKWCA